MAVLKEYKLNRVSEQYITAYKSCTPVSIGYSKMPDKEGQVIITLSVDEDSEIAEYKVSTVFPGGNVPLGATYVGKLPPVWGNAHIY